MSPTQPPHDSDAPLTIADQYRMIRARIEHEDNLITQRLNWFLASQSFLFTAYAISLNAPDSVRGDFSHSLVLALIPTMAILIAFLVFLGVIAGLTAMRHLHHWLSRRFPSDELRHLPPLQWFTRTQYLGMAAPIGLPVLFVVVWIVLIASRRY